MAQVKIYGLRKYLESLRDTLSNTIHACCVEALGIPSKKRFHRFFPMDQKDFIFPEDRSEHYLIIELSIFEGRSVKAKQRLIRLLFQKLREKASLSPQDVEITIFETPQANWGIRGRTGDDLDLNYKVHV